MSIQSNVLKTDMFGLSQLIPFMAESKLPVVIWGEKAVGKTTAVYEWAAKNGYRLEVLHLATQDITDLIGMPNKTPDDVEAAELQVLINKASLGQILSEDEISWIKTTMLANNSKTTWSRPCWLHNDENIKTIFFLDEFNRCNKFVAAAMLPFLLEGRLHQHHIGPHDFVIAACNPSTGNYSVNDAFEYDAALKDRCGHIILEPTQEEFFNFAESKIDKTTMSVIKKHDKYIKINSFDLAFKIEPSRRSLVNVMSVLGKKPDSWIRRFGKTVIGCYLGTEFLGVWWDAKFNKDNYLDIQDLLNFKANKNRILDTIGAIVNGVQTVKQDIYEDSLDHIVDWIEENYSDGITDVTPFIDYMSIPFLPKDSIVSLLSKVKLLSKPKLIETFVESKLLDNLPMIEKIKEYDTLLQKGSN